MEILSPALAEGVNACSNRCIRLMGLQPDEAEKIGLLAAILGWEIEPHHGAGHGVGRVRSWIGDFPDAFGAHDTQPQSLASGDEVAWVKGGWAQGDPGQDSGTDRPAGSPRLVLRQAGSVIRVDVDDAGLVDQLARLGLDRLVLPVSLLALEELLAFAG